MPNIVLIESPYRNGDRNRNLRYLTWCEFHSASMGEVPIASHGNCTAYWPEDDAHRAMGFAWRDCMRDVCAYVCFYTDLGMSEDQQLAEDRDTRAGVVCLRRSLPFDLMSKFERGEYPPSSMRKVAIREDIARPALDEVETIERDSMRRALAGPTSSRTTKENPQVPLYDTFTRYRAVANDRVTASPLLRDHWTDSEILMELNAKGFLSLYLGQHTLVRNGERIMIYGPQTKDDQSRDLLLTLTALK